MLTIIAAALAGFILGFVSCIVFESVSFDADVDVDIDTDEDMNTQEEICRNVFVSLPASYDLSEGDHEFSLDGYDHNVSTECDSGASAYRVNVKINKHYIEIDNHTPVVL